MLTTREWAILGATFVYSLIPTLGGLIRLLELAGGPALAPENPRALAVPLPIILHILGSSVFCVAGVIQFLPSMRRDHPSIHRKMGRILVIAGCVSAASGLWMTWFYPFPDDLQGSLLFYARSFLGLLMIGLIGWAVMAIKARNIHGHAASMLRAYAIGQGASTQALLGLGWIITIGAEPAGLHRDVFMVLCWLLNMLAAEYFLRRFVANTLPSIPALMSVVK